MYNMYFENGVIVTPNVIVKGDNASVTYKGLLSDSGAQSIFMRVGFGDSWDNMKDVQMEKTNGGFEASIPVNDDRPLRMAFKDSANNWDNNAGRNYTFEVQSRL